VTLMLDASIVVMLAVDEPGRNEVVSLLAARDDALVVPDLMFVELSNPLWRKCVASEVTAEQAREALRHSAATFREVVPDRELAGRALEPAVELKHPAYDCFYLTCAIALAGQELTADFRFAAAADRGGHADRILVMGTPA
jgi:predicted nucleic acid-binding protein